MAYAVTIHAEDGRHIKGCADEAAAIAELRSQVGRENVLIGPTYIDDYGREIYAEKLPDGMTAEIHKELLTAYDDRECGTVTAAQAELLKRWSSF